MTISTLSLYPGKTKHLAGAVSEHVNERRALEKKYWGRKLRAIVSTQMRNRSETPQRILFLMIKSFSFSLSIKITI